MSRKYTILIVDDERDLLQIYSEVLPERGFHVVTAYDGKMALDVMRTTHVDAILSDIDMPKLNGLELLDEVQKIDEAKPFFLITGGSKVTKAEAIERGAVRLFDKPPDIDVLGALIKNHLEREKRMAG